MLKVTSLMVVPGGKKLKSNCNKARLDEFSICTVLPANRYWPEPLLKASVLVSYRVLSLLGLMVAGSRVA